MGKRQLCYIHDHKFKKTPMSLPKSIDALSSFTGQAPFPTADQASVKLPKIAVLLASLNGGRWLPEQIRSILDQRDVQVEIFVSDDGSSDGSLEWLTLLSEEHHRVKLLPERSAKSGVGGNFFYLIENAPWQSFDAISLADQDDIWFPDKLSRHYAQLVETKSVGVSSNVIAQWPNGESRILRKSDPQTAFDYIFESAGPGCSFLLHPEFVAFIRDFALKKAPEAKDFEFHDWLIYAMARSQGLRWTIDPSPCMFYRQHEHNHLGANVGVFPALKRARVVANKLYRERVLSVIRVCALCAPSQEPALRQIEAALMKDGFGGRLSRASMAAKFRRSKRDQFALRAFFLLGWW
jgi:rhamnosyltransferase